MKNKKVEEIEKIIEPLKKQFGFKRDTLKRVWREQSYLMCNYRLDIVAKELERWEIGLTPQKIDEEKIKKEIEDLFK